MNNHKKDIRCGYSLEGDSSEYLQYMLLWRTVENYPLIIIKYPPYLFHWLLSEIQSEIHCPRYTGKDHTTVITYVFL